MDPFTKRHKLVHNVRFSKFKVLYNVSKILQNRSRFSKTSVTRYSLPDHKISGELKSCNVLDVSAIMGQSACCYADDDIENTSIIYLPEKLQLGRINNEDLYPIKNYREKNV